MQLLTKRLDIAGRTVTICNVTTCSRQSWLERTTRMPKREKPALSPLENAVMRLVWSRERITAADVRTALTNSQPMKDSTVRTILRRLEQKGYVSHSTQGRTFVYTPRVASRNVATQA